MKENLQDKPKEQPEKQPSKGSTLKSVENFPGKNSSQKIKDSIDQSIEQLTVKPNGPKRIYILIISLLLHIIILAIIFFVLEYSKKDYLFMKKTQPAKVKFQRSNRAMQMPKMQPAQQQKLTQQMKNVEEEKKLKELLKKQEEEKKQEEFELPKLPVYQGLNRLYKQEPKATEPERAKQEEQAKAATLEQLTKILKPEFEKTAKTKPEKPKETPVIKPEKKVEVKESKKESKKESEKEKIIKETIKPETISQIVKNKIKKEPEIKENKKEQEKLEQEKIEKELETKESQDKKIDPRDFVCKKNKPEDKKEEVAWPSKFGLSSKTPDKTENIPGRKNMNLKEISKGFLDYTQQQGANLIQYTNAIEGVPTEEQLKNERYIKKLFDCIETTLKIKSNTLFLNQKIDINEVLTVLVNINLDSDGKLENMAIIRSSGLVEFDRFMLAIIDVSSRAFPPVPSYLLNKNKYNVPVKFFIPAQMVLARAYSY